jgi:hypothetical protein
MDELEKGGFMAVMGRRELRGGGWTFPPKFPWAFTQKGNHISSAPEGLSTPFYSKLGRKWSKAILKLEMAFGHFPPSKF